MRPAPSDSLASFQSFPTDLPHEPGQSRALEALQAMTIRIVAASEQPIFLDGLQALLEAQRDLKVVGRALNGHDAVKRVRRLNPDVVLVAGVLPGLNGIEVAARLRGISAARVIYLSASAQLEQLRRALRAGVQGFLPREATGQELLVAIRAVAGGKRYLGRSLSGRMVQDSAAIEGAPSPLETLSQRERQVLQLIVEGASSSEVSAVLSVSRKTVDTYRSRIRQKLAIGHLPGLVKFAIREGLTSPD